MVSVVMVMVPHTEKGGVTGMKTGDSCVVFMDMKFERAYLLVLKLIESKRLCAQISLLLH